MRFSYLNIVVIVILGLVVLRCIEPFDPPKEDFQDLLVIEGLITDEAKPHQITISRTFPIDTLLKIPVNGASASIVDDLGNKYGLQPVGDGKYETSWPEFQGQPGRTYQLLVTTSLGDMIQSDPVVMKKVPEIDSVSWEISTRLLDDGTVTDGVQIYVSTHDPDNETRNYRWQYIETWEFNTPYPTYYKWSGNQIVVRDENISKCWTNNSSDEILIGSSGNLSDDIISLYPLVYISANASNRLRIKYSILVRQYALSDEAWFYWKQMKKMNQEMGNLFAPQPTAVQGNLHNVTRPQIPVIGYFDASGVKEKRIFISSHDLDGMKVYSGYDYCPVDSLRLADISKYPFKNSRNPMYTYLNEMGFVAGYLMSTIQCTDCTLRGENVKPDFWE